MNTEAITGELLKRWKAGEPGAAAELLFGTGLWEELLKDTPPSQYDAARDALLQVLEELQRRDQDFTPEEFLGILRKQYGRRRKDFVLAELRRREVTLSLDYPRGNNHGEHEDGDGGDTWADSIVASSHADPEQIVQIELMDTLRESLLRKFQEQLREPYRSHLREIKRGLALIYPSAPPSERNCLLFDFLQVRVDRKPGRKHLEDLAGLVIASCCGKRGTYDTHNRRLRQWWHSFISEGPGHSDFEQLRALLAGIRERN